MDQVHKLKKKGRGNSCVIQYAAMSKLNSRKGFGLPNPADDLPFAVALLGTGSDLPTRLQPTLNLPEMLDSSNSPSIRTLDAYLKWAISEAFKVFELPERVVPIHLNDIFYMDLEIRGSSPGIPWQRPKYKTKGDVMDCNEARKSIRWYWYKVKKGESVNPLYTRVSYRAQSMNGNTPKIRAVCEYPATMTFGEAQFALPLIEAYKKGTTPMASGYDMRNCGDLKLGHELMKFDHYCSIDCQKFNKTVSNQLIHYAFIILTQNIDFKCYQGHGVPDIRKLSRAWVYIIDYFKHTPVRLPNDRCQKIAGIPSDSYFTQLIGSIVNYICLTYAVLKLTGRMPRYIRVNGDDAVIATHSIVDEFELFRIIDSIKMEL